MTATSVLDPTAEPLLDEPDRRVCELTRSRPGQIKRVCENPARWVVTSTCECDSVRVLICQQCKNDMGDIAELWCHTCASATDVVHFEAIR